MPRDAILALAGGIAAGLLYVSATLGSPGAMILAYLAPFPVFLVGLALGANAATIAGAAGALTVFAFSTALFGIIFIVATAAPVGFLVSRALQSRPAAATGGVDWYPSGHLLAWLAAMALGALIAAAAYFAAFTEGGLRPAIVTSLGPVLRNMFHGIEGPRATALMHLILHFFPAVMLNSWAFMILVNGVLAQGVLSRYRGNLRPSPPFGSLELPRWTGLALAAAVACAFAPGQLGIAGQNAVVVLLLPFFFAGLAVIHAVSHRWPGRAFILALLYLVIIVFGWPAAVVAVVGIIEQWARIRRRLAPPGPGQEDV